MPASLSVTCGQLLVVGFPGLALPPALARALAAGERGGVILFRHNVGPELAAVAALVHDAAHRTPADRPLLVGIDQEGGRVQRLGAPTLRLPPMKRVADAGDADLARRLGKRQGEELAALGITMNFAPVLDVNIRPENPIIGDRAFGDDPGTVTRFGLAFAQGLAEGGVDACGKHYPGHGDTTVDSHLALPTVARDRDGLEAVELAPFRAAAAAGIAALMTAHVLYPALDATRPATLSRFIATDLLRGALGFRGVLVSDDMEMGALKDERSLEDAAVEAVAAGCDVLLVCSSEEAQARAHEGLVREAERSAAFRARCEEAEARGLALRRARPPRPLLDAAALAERVGGEPNRRLEDELTQRLAAKGAR